VPNVVKFYNKSRSGLKHNMGSLFGCVPKKEKEKPPAEKVAEKILPKTTSILERRKKALEDIPYD